jgi:hypothetical protein
MMKQLVSTSNLTVLAHRVSRFAQSNLVRATLAGVLLLHAHSASAVLSFVRGIPTGVGSVQFSSSADGGTVTGALTAPGTVTTGLAIAANRIQYDVINSDQGPLFTWTVYYAPSVGPRMIGAVTPLGYVDWIGTTFPEGGVAYMTLFNVGYGVYNYNTGAPWSIDYEPDHITFLGTGGPPPGLPANAGVGELNPTPYLPSFAILYDPNLGNGLVPASATVASLNMNGQVYGPLPDNSCISIQATNITVYTCSNCTTVPFTATATDPCCTNVVLTYSVPATTCFARGSTTPVQVTATDDCGNATTAIFTVTVNPGPGCGPTNCIAIYATNITVYTCSNCTTVPFTATAYDTCCSNLVLTYNPPTNTCFPRGVTTPVQITATDDCGNTATVNILVTVSPAAGCGPTNCIAIYATNITVSTCSNCTTVPFTATAYDTCCSNLVLTYNPPTNTCFPRGVTTPVQITATDDCGNTATVNILVTVNPGAGCGPTNCIAIYATNITVSTCSNCTTVPFTATAYDPCCTNVVLTYSLPATTCFPLGVTTPVLVTATDDCGNTATAAFTVTVNPGPGCGGPGSGLTITTGSRSATNLTISWPGANAQLMESSDLVHWSPVPGATNSPYLAPKSAPHKFFRLLYN